MTQCFYEGDGVAFVELAAEVGDVGFDDVGVMLPVVVVEMLEQFFAGDDDARAVDEVLEDAVLGGREIEQAAVAMDGLLERVSSTSAKRKMGCDAPLPRRMRALTRAISSPRSKGLLR